MLSRNQSQNSRELIEEYVKKRVGQELQKCKEQENPHHFDDRKKNTN